MARSIARKQKLERLRAEAADCQACELYKLGTQTVFGEGASLARILFVGEQPGDYEDRAGRPFVGPAGKLLDDALADAGIDRSETYVTNAVKHFKWEPRGKRRIHKKPNAREIRACSQWLDAEIETVRPDIIVCLGATAAQALLGPDFRVTKQRGVILTSSFGQRIMATLHPSSILRQEDGDLRSLERSAFVRDLKQIPRLLNAA
jgi:DNA polymerase